MSEARKEFAAKTSAIRRERLHRLFHAGARYVLARIELAAGYPKVAVKAAIKAYKEAWCDGPPYAYQSRLQPIGELLAELNHEPPHNLPAFDHLSRQPLPIVHY